MNNTSNKVEFKYFPPTNRVKIKPATIGELTCKYCHKKLVNQNAHSGHMRTCGKRLSIRKSFREENSNIFQDENEALKRWNTLDHSYFNLFEYEVKSSERAVEFIRNQFGVMSEFNDSRMKEYCVFYLVVIAQIADSNPVRKEAFEHLQAILSEDEVDLLKTYWKSLGARRYEPTAESYSGTWTRFVRIKDACFFNIDYPVWILLLDRYILTYKMFGWEQSDTDRDIEYFRDLVLYNVRELLILEQDYLGVPASQVFQCHVPKDVIKLLHPSSRERFSRDENIWIPLSKMKYDPRDSDAANFI